MCHDSIPLKYEYSDEPIDIDVGIAPLMELIWQAGFQTDGSCQEIKPGFLWVKFSYIIAGREFIDLIHTKLRDRYPDVLAMQHHEDYLCPRALGMDAPLAISPPWRIIFPLCGGLSIWIPRRDQDIIETLLSS